MEMKYVIFIRETKPGDVISSAKGWFAWAAIPFSRTESSTLLTNHDITDIDKDLDD